MDASRNALMLAALISSSSHLMELVSTMMEFAQEQLELLLLGMCTQQLQLVLI